MSHKRAMLQLRGDLTGEDWVFSLPQNPLQSGRSLSLEEGGGGCEGHPMVRSISRVRSGVFTRLGEQYVPFRMQDKQIQGWLGFSSYRRFMFRGRIFCVRSLFLPEIWKC